MSYLSQNSDFNVHNGQVIKKSLHYYLISSSKNQYYNGNVTIHCRQVTQSEQELALCQNMTDTSLQTILAERVDDLIIELTALRAKISEMREEHTYLV